MKATFTAAVILALGATSPFAHRLDEYLQGAIVSVEKNRLETELTMTPGVAIFPELIAEIDADGDGTISAAEQRAYALRVVHDLSLALDGHPLTPRLLTFQFPSIAEMKDGLGEIRLVFEAELPAGGANRRLVIENHHLNRISVYQVNCLVSRDPDIRIVAQKRNYSQSFYELDFEQAGAHLGPLDRAWWAGTAKPLATFSLIALSWLILLGQRRWRLPDRDA